MSLTPRYISLMPWVFVWIWSTGFLAAKFGQPYAEPFTLLCIRFVFALLVLWALMPLFKTSIVADKKPAVHSMVVGIMIHGLYLGGVFQAIKMGMPAGISSMVIGLQPLVMVLVAGAMLHEKVTKKQWLGLTTGLLGLYMVLSEHITSRALHLFDGFSGWAVVFVVMALLGISVGSIYQKRFCQGINLLSSIWWQYIAALIVCGIISLAFETQQVHWHWAFLASLSWQVLGLSIGAILLLLMMMEMGESARVASLFYLVPPAVAVQAWLLFDETLGWVALLGLLVISLGVALARGKVRVKTFV